MAQRAWVKWRSSHVEWEAIVTSRCHRSAGKQKNHHQKNSSAPWAMFLSRSQDGDERTHD